ncbi:MAG TPA: hypothetical protein VIF57_11305 [Polyangia bacterium]
MARGPFVCLTLAALCGACAGSDIDGIGHPGTAGSGAAAGSGGGGAPGSAGTAGGAGTTGTGGSSAGGAPGGRSAGCGKTLAQTGAFQATITVGALARGYYVAIPATYDPAVPRALVFGYHGSDYTGKMMRTYLDMEKAPLVDKAIYVYPDGLPPADQPSKAWDLSANGMDMPFFDAMLAQMSADYCVDPARVFVAGQSYGALMTNAVGCFRGDVIRAIAAVAGSGPSNPSQCKGPVAVWITHGMDDDSVAFTSGEKSRDFWLMEDGCTTTTTQGTPMECQNYQGCMPGYPVIWCPHVGETGHQEPPWGRVAVREFFAGF